MNIPTREQIDKLIEDFPFFLGQKYIEDNDVSGVLFALRALRLMMDEPSDEMIDAYIAEKHAAFAEDTARCKFKAMRDKLLEMARVG